jgi:hypothetical protein
MVRGFLYQGEQFRATVHGRPGKEEIFIVHITDDNEEGAEISLDRFEDAGNDPNDSLDSVLVSLVDKLIKEQSIAPANPSAGFTWRDERVVKQVHSGLQH